MFWKKDPVCKARIKNGGYTIQYNGKTYYFDSEACMETFKKEPERFIKTKKGVLEKILKPQQDAPKCH